MISMSNTVCTKLQCFALTQWQKFREVCMNISAQASNLPEQSLWAKSTPLRSTQDQNGGSQDEILAAFVPGIKKGPETAKGSTCSDPQIQPCTEIGGKDRKKITSRLRASSSSSLCFSCLACLMARSLLHERSRSVWKA